LDTSILVDALRNRQGRREFLDQLILQGAKLASCAITVAEIHAGMRAHENTKTTQWLATLEFFETTQGIAKFGGDLKAAYARKGVTLSLTDTLIAAVAIENDLTLATDNVKDFPMPEVRLLPLPKAH
jgi:predicted nucleic acid-binding protein